jgi:hypothetical protein
MCIYLCTFIPSLIHLYLGIGEVWRARCHIVGMGIPEGWYYLGFCGEHCGNTGIWAQGLHALAVYAFRFSDEVLLFAGPQPWTMILPPKVSQLVWQVLDAQFIFLRWSLTFFPVWPWTLILPISTFQVDGTIGMMHLTQILRTFLS